MNQTESSICQLYRSFQFKKLSVCQARSGTAYPIVRKVASLDVEQMIMVNSVLKKKEQNQLQHSLGFYRFLNILMIE